MMLFQQCQADLIIGSAQYITVEHNMILSGNAISFTNKMTSSYWIRALTFCGPHSGNIGTLGLPALALYAMPTVI